MREVCYIIQGVGVVFASVTVLAIDLSFCGLCLYIVAMYKELQRILCRIDNMKEHRLRLCDCIEFHLVILR